jgi:hypothetical protein
METGGRIAQYYGLENLAAMKAKLGQYPRGTQFTVRAYDSRSVKAAAELRRFAADHGIVIREQ